MNKQPVLLKLLISIVADGIYIHHHANKSFKKSTVIQIPLLTLLDGATYEISDFTVSHNGKLPYIRSFNISTI